MDTAIKAEWYDVEDGDREGFLSDAGGCGSRGPTRQAQGVPLCIFVEETRVRSV